MTLIRVLYRDTHTHAVPSLEHITDNRFWCFLSDDDDVVQTSLDVSSQGDCRHRDTSRTKRKSPVTTTIEKMEKVTTIRKRAENFLRLRRRSSGPWSPLPSVLRRGLGTKRRQRTSPTASLNVWAWTKTRRCRHRSA